MNGIGAFIVLTRKNQSEVFLVKRSDFPVWECQSGGIENKETPEAAVIRECYEETGFKIKVIRKVAEYTNPKSKNTISHVFEGEYISGKFKPEYNGCEGKWFNVNKLPLKMSAVRKSMITDCLKNYSYIIRKKQTPSITPQNLILLLLLPYHSLKFILKSIH